MTRGGRGLGLASNLALGALALHAALLVAAPMLVLVLYAFADRDELGDVVASPSTEAVRRVFSPTYLRVLAGSAGVAATVTFTCIALAVPLAWTIASAPPPWGRRLLALVLVPFFTSILVRAYALMTLLAADGWVAGALGATGLGSPSSGMLYTPGAALLGLVSVYLPMAVLPVHASLLRLDGRLVEAALDLGATPPRALWAVVLPALRPGLWAAASLTFLPSIGMFAVVDLLGGGRVPLVGSVIASSLGAGRDWPFGAALGVCLVACFFGLGALRALVERRARG